MSSSSESHSIAPGDIFATTHWTVVLAAGRRHSPQANLALEELCRTYWYPLYAYVRRQGHTREDAEDLTQAFFARFLAKNYLEGLRSEKGKFRAFLLAALKHFLSNEWDRAGRQKRGGDATFLSLNWQSADSRYQIDPAGQLSPDRLYDRAWAVTLLEKVVTRLRAEYAAEKKTELFDHLKPFLMVGKSAIPYGQAAAALAMSEGAVRVAVHRLRRRYRELLREEIAQTLTKPAQLEEELRALFRAFADRDSELCRPPPAFARSVPVAEILTQGTGLSQPDDELHIFRSNCYKKCGTDAYGWITRLPRNRGRAAGASGVARCGCQGAPAPRS